MKMLRDEVWDDPELELKTRLKGYNPELVKFQPYNKIVYGVRAHVYNTVAFACHEIRLRINDVGGVPLETD